MKDKMTYTCPMHPEVKNQGPGACPKCGMDLEPMSASEGGLEDETRNPYQKRLFVCALLTIPVFCDAMFGLLPQKFGHWVQLGLTTPVFLWGGWPFLIRAWESIKNKSPNMFTLIAMGTGAAYVYSIFALFLPFLFPDELKTNEGIIPVYFEAATVIITLVLFGQFLEHRARQKTGSAIRSLLALSPQTTHVLKEDGTEEDLPIGHVKLGDRLRVKPGESIPVDGIVLDGRSPVNESMMTGEPFPVTKKINDWVLGGTLNTTGAFLMKAERVGENTLLSQIIQRVKEAERSRAPIQNLADKVSGLFVPSVILISILTFISWIVFGPHPKLAYAILTAVSVLIVACPCALGLATPISIMVAMGRGAKEGILFKNAETLQTLAEVDTFVFDKTGTLTEGRYSVDFIHAEEGFDENTILQSAASIEINSEHPIATAVVEKAREKGLRIENSQNFKSISGKGVTGIYQGHVVVIGNLKFLRERLVPLGSLEKESASYKNKGGTLVYLSIQNKPAGFIVLADSIKNSSMKAISTLKKSKCHVLMVTGDSKESAERVARELDIDEVKANILPTQKGDIIKELQKKGKKVAMAGDGINDAPALTEAHVGIAMGNGTDIAIQSADMTLIKGNLEKLANARELSLRTMRNIRQNLFFAFVYNFLGVPIAAGVLYPFFGLLLSPMIAGAAMSFSSVSVIWNALRLRD